MLGEILSSYLLTTTINVSLPRFILLFLLYSTFPLLPLPPSWSSHCQSTPLTTRPPVKIPLAVIFFDLRRDSRRTLQRVSQKKKLKKEYFLISLETEKKKQNNGIAQNSNCSLKKQKFKKKEKLL